MQRFPFRAGRPAWVLLCLALLPAACLRSNPTGNVHRPMPSADGRKLALMSDRDGNWEMYVVDLEDGSSRRITDDPGFDGYADWSPDGAILYFGRSGQLLRYGLQSGAESNLGEGGALRVSPDGSQIVFQSERSGDRELYRMASDGSVVSRLTEHPGADQDATFSPDGARIAWVSEVGEARDLFVMNADGSGQRRITRGMRNAYGTDWSPDGRSIVFTAEADGDQELFLASVESGEVRRLTQRPGVDHMPVFWPDGTRILYTAYVEEAGGEREQLRMLSLAEGSAPVPLEFEADGRMIAESLAALTRRPETLVISGVHIVPMDREAVLRNRAVVVRGGMIAEISEADAAPAPVGARVIEGRGRYLFPGLMDLHAHPDDARALALYLAHGVTTIRDMGGDEGHLVRRDRVAGGGLAGPRAYVAGPPLFLEGENGDQGLRDPETARRAVREIAAAGYDLVKVVRLDPPDAVPAVVDEARRAGLAVAGHLPTFGWTLAELSSSGMASVEHVTELLWLAFEGRTDPAEIPVAVASLQSGGIAVGSLFTSALRAKRMIELGEAYFETADAAEMVRWLGPPAAEGARGYLDYLAGVEPWEVERRRIDRAFAQRFLAAIYRAGIPLVAGTDSHTAWAIAGISLHDELALFVEGGLSPYEALRTATVNGGALLGIAAEAGTIEPGKRADLLLVTSNPLDDPAVLRHPDTVIAAGRVYPREELDFLAGTPARPPVE